MSATFALALVQSASKDALGDTTSSALSVVLCLLNLSQLTPSLHIVVDGYFPSLSWTTWTSAKTTWFHRYALSLYPMVVHAWKMSMST